jgi:hypothetical protein
VRRKTARDRQDEQVRMGQRRAARRACPRCGADTYAGPDADVMALDATADVTPVGAAAELVAVSSEPPRSSYWLRNLGDGVELIRRDQWQLRGRPAGHPEGWPVVLEHQCPGARPQPVDPNLGAGLFTVPPGHDVGTPSTVRAKRAAKEKPRA